MKRQSLVSLAFVMATSGGLYVAASPALAAPSAFGPCDNNVTCVYDGAYAGFLGSRSPGSPLQNISAPNRKRLTSWINNSNTNARFYYGLNGTGTCVPMYAQDHAAASAGNPDNNKAQSFAFNRGC